MIDYQEELNIIWAALEAFREDCIPEGDSNYDRQWNDICTAMALLTEELENTPSR
jgi:hypothetical protein